MPIYLNLFVSCMLRKTFTFFGLSNLIRNRAEEIVGDAHKLWPVLILELIWFSSKTHLFHWFGIFSHFDWTWCDQIRWWHSQDDNIVISSKFDWICCNRRQGVCVSVCLSVCVCLCHLYSPNEWTDFDETFHKTPTIDLRGPLFSNFENSN